MKRKGIGIILCMAMAAGMLSGCANNSKGAAESVEITALAEDNQDEHMDISVWQYSQEFKYYASYDDNPIVQYLNDKFNISLKYQMPPLGSEADNFNIMLSTGDYTDLMCTTYSNTALPSLYEDGVIIDISPYLEEYMPNYYKLIQENEEVRRFVYDDDGRAYGIYLVDDPNRAQWGGMVYRRDILETMTGGNVSFPSGSDEPTTVEDWEYMLPLMKAYLDATGITETASLIIPANGYIVTGELLSGFGTSGNFQLSRDKSDVEYGPVTDEFYNYVCKMKEWYEAGYIYSDFASRTNDMFYLPNTSLTYGGAAGIWFGLDIQLGDALSLPEYDLNVRVEGMKAPLDVEHGITESDASFCVYGGAASMPWCISTKCDESKYARIFSCLDYLYSEEGSKLKKHGLNKEQAAGSELYKQYGLEDGTYYYDENGDYCSNEVYFDKEKALDRGSFTGNLLPGLDRASQIAVNDPNIETREARKRGQEAWIAYGRDRNFPAGALMNTEESTSFNAVYTNITDYVDSMIPKFIMGTEELSEASWEKYVAKVEALGLEQALNAQKSAYERYKAR